MTCSELMMDEIKAETVISKLEFMRDNGLDMAIIKFRDFTTVEKAKCVTLINERIAELVGTV